MVVTANPAGRVAVAALVGADVGVVAVVAVGMGACEAGDGVVVGADTAVVVTDAWYSAATADGCELPQALRAMTPTVAVVVRVRMVLATAARVQAEKGMAASPNGIGVVIVCGALRRSRRLAGSLRSGWQGRLFQHLTWAGIGSWWHHAAWQLGAITRAWADGTVGPRPHAVSDSCLRPNAPGRIHRQLRPLLVRVSVSLGVA